MLFRTHPFATRFAATALVASWALPADAAEVTGQVRGAVVDSAGLSVPGVTLNLSSASMQGVRAAESEGDGTFRFVALPPGNYTLTAAKAGFRKANAEFRVITGLTASVTIELALQTAGEEIVVTDSAVVVDTTSTRSGTVMTKEMIRDIPNAGRDYQGVTDFAPGVVSNGTGNNNVRGSLSYGNQYYVDGVNSTDPLTNTFGLNMNFDAIEEVQVITGGMDAEYGRSMGGAINIVTRSGGNSFEGDAQFLYNSAALEIYKPLDEEIEQYDTDGDGKISAEETPPSVSQSLALNLGGPIMKDKLWFFTGLQLNNQVSTALVPEDVGRPAEYPMQSETWRSAYIFGKLTWRPADAHKIWIQGQLDPTNIDNADRSIYTMPNAELWWQQGGWLGSLGHTWTPDAATVVDTQLYAASSYLRIRPMQWQECSGSDYDDRGFCTIDFEPEQGSWFPNQPDGFSWGPYPYSYYTSRNRYALQSSATRFFSFLGEHQAKLGMQAEILDSVSSYPGLENGIEYWNHDGDPTNFDGYTPAQIVIYDDAETPLRGTLLSWYIQDVWQPTNRLTFRPGLRFDKARFLDNEGTVIYDPSITLSPRLGAAYDLTGDGRTRIHAYYGRFYDSGFLEISSILAKGVNGVQVFDWSAQDDDWSTTPSYSAESDFLQHDDLLVPVSDEIDIGLARDVGGGWSLEGTFTYERARNLWEDDEVNLIWNDEGTQVIGSRDGTGETYYRMRTPDEAFVEYTALELAANKQFDDKWGMLSSYTWSRAYGRARNDIAQGLASAAFDIPTQHDEEVGLMPYDVPHNIKMAGSYRDAHAWQLNDKTALGFLFGWNFQMSSGFPYRPVYYNDYYGGWYSYREGIDGSWRLPAYSRTDLKGGFTIAQGRTSWDLTVECFNVFNTRTTTAVSTEADTPSGEPYTDADGEILFGQTIARQSPRFFQLGLRGEF